MNGLPYMIAGLILAAGPVCAQNLTLPAGSEQAFRAHDIAVAQPAQPFALQQGRSAYERHDAMRHRRFHRQPG